MIILDEFDNYPTPKDLKLPDLPIPADGVLIIVSTPDKEVVL